MDETSSDELIRRLSELIIRQERDLIQVIEEQNEERRSLIKQIERTRAKNRRKPASGTKKEREDTEGTTLFISDQATVLASDITDKAGDKSQAVNFTGSIVVIRFRNENTTTRASRNLSLSV